jgi:hypothetical protein
MTAERRWRRPGWVLLVLLWTALPLAAVLAVQPLLFAIYGDGGTIAPDTTGSDLVTWWDDQWGREIAVGAIALVVLLARRVFPPLALALAAVAGGLTLVWLIAMVLVAVIFFGASLD